ncbi:PTS sugar transporter subunit IIA [Jiangella rhizosphaerae]|uniref:PTS sugar transporter subunit IIA n=1 Tax=Jiangella rhizosphaerae TaxID=2293569 RepID=A0A418KPT8_9ACTN|nr:PTS sugar transporter subunit IIA [Jiangella rhizosphaerae]RIQ21649.1 PTS sugar transporter subunit IIA [Jiangella rhizosphaerae]
MTSIVVTGHGSFATSLVETAEMIVGSTEHVHAVDFPVGSGVDELTERVESLIDRVNPAGEPGRVLILADVLGGSPARVALAQAAAGRADVVTGVNLPMVVDLALGAGTSSAPELAARAVTAGQDGIRDAGALVRPEGGVR